MKEIASHENAKKNLEWFKKFIDICESNKLWYSVIFGTMIGTVREKGPIPYDDDFDVIMTIEGYEKLKKLFPKNCLDGVVNKKYPLVFPKFVPTLELNYLFTHSIFVDIFIIYPTTKEKTHKLSSLLNKSRTGMTLIHSFLKHKKLVYKFIKFFTWIFLPLFKKMNYKCVDEIICIPKNYECYYIVCTPWNYDPKLIVDKNFKFQTTSMPFANFHVNVIKNYDKYLTQLYGDYMTPVDYGYKHTNTFDWE